ncbi:hypothetical protein MDA_GLEAN10001291 [Myotis davidii]|uniref:Uncharacterized protein n=1 Tax=Myotis davidii TaxID=225400 RepID=L5M319_MYODS|nr:hypothetical protein MDA_GLEAN10001291 [Myotis davidii]
MDQLPPVRPTLGIEPTTRACALTGNRTLTSWFTGLRSTTEPHRPGGPIVFNVSSSEGPRTVQPLPAAEGRVLGDSCPVCGLSLPLETGWPGAAATKARLAQGTFAQR